MTPSNKPTHGGKREGAGRKPGPLGAKEQIAIWVSADVKAFLDAQPCTRGATVDEIVRKTKAFRDWLAAMPMGRPKNQTDTRKG